jgi:hypothetical protein
MRPGGTAEEMSRLFRCNKGAWRTSGVPPGRGEMWRKVPVVVVAKAPFTTGYPPVSLRDEQPKPLHIDNRLQD